MPVRARRSSLCPLCRQNGCTFEYAAPAAVAIEPGHDAWVVGDEPAVLVEVDFERETAQRFGLPPEHTHA